MLEIFKILQYYLIFIIILNQTEKNSCLKFLKKIMYAYVAIARLRLAFIREKIPYTKMYAYISMPLKKLICERLKI